MKRLMLVWVMILCMVPLGGWAEEDTAPTLYPICVNGLWGYMDRAGEVVIEPQWIIAEAFSDGWAIVESDEGTGLINTSGMYAIQPSDCIQIEEYAHAYTVYDYELEGYGFFDKTSGFYQVPRADYEMILLWGEDGKGPIAVRNTDYLTGYVSRTTGETVIPFRYTGESEDVAFNEGYALAASLTWLDENDVWHEVLPDGEQIPDNNDEILGEGMRYYLIDTTGKEVRFPDGLEPYTGVSQGVLVIHPDPGIQREMPEDQEEDAKPEADDPYFFDSFGIARPDGTVVLAPRQLYYLWGPDSEGILCYVGSSWGDCGHMNLNGEVIVPAKYRIDGGGAMPSYTFFNGYAVIDDIGDNWPDSERWVVLDTAGTEVFTQPSKAEDGTTFRICEHAVLKNGLFWCEEANGYSLMRLTDHGAERVSDACFEAYLGNGYDEDRIEIDFTEGLHSAKQNGLWGYIDEQAQWVIPPQYDSADSFRDGLAMVEKDGRLMCIDHSGAAVWEETPELSLAEEQGLFPAEDENGKWGYVDGEGSFVIPPEFDHAFGFRGNYAEVVVFPKDYAGDRHPYHCGYSGIIDRNGAFVLEPIYDIDAGYDEMFYGGRDTGIWCISAGEANQDNLLEGWFDVESGYFSGLVWESVWGWVSDSRLIPVMDETYCCGYADRRTGELVIPCQYESVDPSCFYSGVASVSLTDEDGESTGYFLIDETGAEIPLPDGVFAVQYEGAHDGLVLVADRAAIGWFYDTDALFGYVDQQGDPVIDLQFSSARHFHNGKAVVQFQEGDWGFIDTAGLVLERGLAEKPVWEDVYESELDNGMDE